MARPRRGSMLMTARRPARLDRHRLVAIGAGGRQAAFVLAPQLVLLRAEEVEVIPREDAGVVAVAEGRLHCVVADWLESLQADVALARLQHLLAGTMPL